MLRGQGGTRMPSIGTGSVDIRSIIGSIVNFARSKTIQRAYSPCDGIILKIHYRYTFFLLLAGFFSVWYGWYHRDVITCVSHFNADTQVRLDYINVCLSYPYLELEDEKRRYLLFYRWIHYTFILLAAVFYIPRKISKNWENPKLKNLFEKLALTAPNIDKTELDNIEITYRYLMINIHTHNGIYLKYVTVNAITFIIDILSLHFLDFVLQNRFISYGYQAYPYERDPKEFTDYMSQTFPPFASCTIDETNQLTAKRGEKFGCHLTFMELYEKMFLFLWLWMYILITVTILNIVGLLFLNFKIAQRYMLRTAKSSYMASKEIRVQATIKKLTDTCNIGDVYLLYCLKPYFTHARFLELLTRVSKFTEDPKSSHLPYHDKEKHMQPHNMPPQNVRNRRPNQMNQVNPEMLEQLLRGGDSNKMQDQVKAPLIKKEPKPNTAVYID